jgi:hypothetical protein
MSLNAVFFSEVLQRFIAVDNSSILYVLKTFGNYFDFFDHAYLIIMILYFLNFLHIFSLLCLNYIINYFFENNGIMLLIILRMETRKL